MCSKCMHACSWCGWKAQFKLQLLTPPELGHALPSFSASFEVEKPETRPSDALYLSHQNPLQNLSA